MRVSLLVAILAAAPAAVADLNEDLLAAARKGDAATVSALLGRGAGIESKTAYGQTPLYLAAMNGHEPTVQILLDKGANPDVQDTFYKAPMLAFVIMRKHYTIATLLIAKTTANLEPALDMAVNSGQPEIVKAILGKAKPSQSSLDKAFELALTRKDIPIADLLKAAGAQPPVPPAQVDPKILASYLGSFKSADLPLDIKISVKDGILYVQATGQPEFAPKPKSATLFEFNPAGLQVEFDSPSSFTLRQGGRSFAFKKATE